MWTIFLYFSFKNMFSACFNTGNIRSYLLDCLKLIFWLAFDQAYLTPRPDHHLGEQLSLLKVPTPPLQIRGWESFAYNSLVLSQKEARQDLTFLLRYKTYRKGTRKNKSIQAIFIDRKKAKENIRYFLSLQITFRNPFSIVMDVWMQSFPVCLSSPAVFTLVSATYVTHTAECCYRFKIVHISFKYYWSPTSLQANGWLHSCYTVYFTACFPIQPHTETGL